MNVQTITIDPVDGLLNKGLKNLWYAVCPSDFVKEQPISLRRFGRKIAMWRDAEGQVHALEGVAIDVPSTEGPRGPASLPPYSTTITDLAPGTAYKASVRTMSDHGDSPATSTAAPLTRNTFQRPVRLTIWPITVEESSMNAISGMVSRPA